LQRKKGAYYTLGRTDQVRADGPPSAQVRRQKIEVSTDVAERPLRAPRANPVFGADERRIRSKNRVMDKINGGGRNLRRHV
jgi:hypothetical protein